MVDSWPPCVVCDEVKAVPTLLASCPSCHSWPAWSMNCLSWAATLPKRVGVPKATPSAHSRSSRVATGSFSIWERWRPQYWFWEISSSESTWRQWRDVRDELFRGHPQSPVPVEDRARFARLSYFEYDPALRVVAGVEPADGELRRVGASGGETVLFRRFGTARFDLEGDPRRLALYWLEAYGGGLFLPFADLTSGGET